MAVSSHIPSERDLELLSAYLDGALPDRERDQLEQRLARDQTLRAVLDELRDTVALVRDLPRLKAPRSFTLDPTVYARRIPWWRRLLTLDMALQFSGALGAVASVVIIVLAVLMNQGTAFESSSRAEKDSAGQALSSEVALQVTNAAIMRDTDLPEVPLTDETAIAYSGAGLFQNTMQAQSTYYADLPTPTLGYTASPPANAMGEESEGEAQEGMTVMEAAGAAAAPSEGPPDALDGAEGPPMMQGDEYFAPPGEPGAAADEAFAPPGAGQNVASPPPAAFAPEPSAITPELMLAAPSVAATSDDSLRIREDDEDVQATSVANAASGEVALVPTLTADALLLTPAEEAPTTASEKREEEPDDTATSDWWLMGFGLATLALSMVLFILGRQRSRG
jgi:hypothetical protein